MNFAEKCYSESENLQTIGNILHDERNTNNDKLKTEWTTCKGQVNGAGCYNPGDDRGWRHTITIADLTLNFDYRPGFSILAASIADQKMKWARSRTQGTWRLESYSMCSLQDYAARMLILLFQHAWLDKVAAILNWSLLQLTGFIGYRAVTVGTKLFVNNTAHIYLSQQIKTQKAATTTDLYIIGLVIRLQKWSHAPEMTNLEY